MIALCPGRSNEENSYFKEFFQDHMRKIILLRRGEEPSRARYISKNNGNIARIGLLYRLFPDSLVIVPFRNSLDHAVSLLQQQRNFLCIHAED